MSCDVGEVTDNLENELCVTLILCGFHRGRISLGRFFPRVSPHFRLPKISFYHCYKLVSFTSFHLINPGDGVTGVVDRHSCFSQALKCRG